MKDTEGKESRPVETPASKLDKMFADIRQQGRIGLMTHIIFGYPSVEASRQLIEIMVRSGVDLIEIQLPFSDPTADGPTITQACQKVINRGVRVSEGIEFLEEMAQTYPIPFLFMSYYNILFNYRTSPDDPRGPESFIRAAAKAGASGLIVPDIPPDEVQEGYPEACKEHGLHPIYVISPNITDARLEAVKNYASGFLYCTSRTGTTGKVMELQMEKLNKFLDHVKASTDLPRAVGLSISSREQIDSLQPRAEMAVVGSHLVRVFDNLGLAGLERELRTLTGQDP
jgi:tryptophan synthase alpha chain